MVRWRVGAMVGARRGAVAAAGRQHGPPTTASYRRAGRGFDSPARAHTNPRNNRPRCAWFSSPSFVAAVFSPRLLPLPSPFFSPSFAAVVSSACFCPLSPSSPLPAAPCSSPPFVAAACLLPPLQAPSGTGAGTAGGAARGPVGGGGPVGAYRHLRLDPALLLAPVAAPRAALAPVGGARCVHCQPGQGHLRWWKKGRGTISRRRGGCKNNH